MIDGVDTILIDSHGLPLWTRPHLLDYTVIDEVVRDDTYRLKSTDLAGRTVIDCGAHIGVFANRCAQLGARRVVCIEPEPGNLDVLALNVARWPQIEVIAKALGSEAGTARVGGESGGAHTMGTGAEANLVDQITLTDVLDRYAADEIHLLKLDMEGAEVDVLLSVDAEHLQRVKLIVMETHGPHACPWVAKPRIGELLEHLLLTHSVEAFGYPMGFGKVYATRQG